MKLEKLIEKYKKRIAFLKESKHDELRLIGSMELHLNILKKECGKLRCREGQLIASYMNKDRAYEWDIELD